MDSYGSLAVEGKVKEKPTVVFYEERDLLMPLEVGRSEGTQLFRAIPSTDREGSGASRLEKFARTGSGSE